MEYWSFPCFLINHKGGEKSAAVMKYAVCFQQLASLPALLWISQSDYTRCRLVVGGEGCVREQWASRLCLPDTHWWLNGCVWVQEDDLAWRRRHASQRWRADIRAGWFDGDKKDVWSLGPQSCCHWRGLGRADEMWVTAAQMHNIPQPKSPWTLFSYKEPIYYKYCHKAYRAVDFVASLWTQRCSLLKTVPECHYVSEASTSCMRDCGDISYGYYYMLPSLCCYIRQALTLGNQPSSVCC